ncbi:MAG: two-component system, chemotaxis family, CheB/CheR fusion protein [Acidobacteriota bacterium]|jgi:two-component system CheB/CheR fusion protein|nr:two-component system, chemotaxis family, CheB/CheR fusion protein [Acidobacteriota bacterium]
MSNTPDGDGAALPGSGAGDGFMVVALGASAGGIRAFKEFFTHAPERSGMAYVVILHLSPEHESRLAEVLQSSTRMPVTQVTESVKVAPDHVYVIPPNRSLSVVDGSLVLSEVTRVEERRAPVDIFFRTLAETHGSRAACVVLSGTGADGSMGLKRVKENGGLAIVQDPSEAEYPDMPRNSIATGLVDLVLPVAEMPARLISYRDNLRRIAAGGEEEEEETSAAPGLRSEREAEEQALASIITQLRLRTGHDFTSYKRATVRRRIERRITVTQVADLAEYARFIREHPDEARALLKDMLISVTNFFRDREAFDVLERSVIPKLFENKGPNGFVRVWVAGCATGEEAYSLAMMLSEYAQSLAAPPSVQVFASDIDVEAIATARAGFYTLNDAADVSPELLRRYFTKVSDGYSIRRELRELVLFAHHNLLRDPPFSHIDLVTCRNLLIYLDRSGQERAMNIFHFALNPGSYLFLGASETAGDYSDLFVSADKESHIFQARTAVPRIHPQMLAAALPRPSMQLIPELKQENKVRERLAYLDLHQRLLEMYAPPSVLINAEYEIVHLSESAGRYIVLPGGEPTHNLLAVVRPELRLELRSALFQAAQDGTNVEVPPVPVRVGEHTEAVKLVVRPVTSAADTARGFYLILFGQTAEDIPATTDAEIMRSVEPAARQLDAELAHVRAQLRSTIEQYEVQHEELRASNEELQAMNEELRSTAEELETSKEELQSANEELTTINQELKIKIEELSQSNNDLLNLMNATDIGTVFLDRALRVKLFTPRARDIFNFIPGDVGRPLSDITDNLKDFELTADAERVLSTLRTVEHEVQTRDGRWHLMRVLPYRTQEDRIDGVVVTFLDVSAHRLAEEELRQTEGRLRLLIESVKDYAIFSVTPDYRVSYWNAGAERVFGFAEEEVKGRPIDVIFTPEDRAAGVPAAELAEALETGRAADERWHVRKDGSRFYASGVVRPVMRDGMLYGFVKVARDLTAGRTAEEILRKAHDGLEARVVERTGELRDTVEAMLAEVKERRTAEEHARTLVGQLVTAQEDERRRISRDLHDLLGQQLTAIRLKLAALKGACGDHEELCAQVEAVQELAERVDSEVDFLAWELRPTALDDLGLDAALANFVEEWSKHYLVPAEFHAAPLGDARLPPAVETCLYRIAQEALNNVYKHAQAARVSVILERTDGHAVLVVEDDGVGFDQAEAPGWEGERGLGLVGMRERAALLGGSFEFESEPGKGTTIFARVPAEANGGGGVKRL